MPNWLSHLQQLALPFIPWALGISLVSFIASILLLPVVCLLLPADHFIDSARPSRPPLLTILIWLLRNLAALVLLILGILMLVLPGQGLLTIFLAIACSDVPGKQRLERALMRHPPIYKAANWIRKRYHRRPFTPPKGFRDD